MYSLKLKKLVLIDFGISNVINENVGEKTMTNFIGTFEYSTEEMKKLFFSKETQPIDLYWNDVYSLK
jgi:hypothetical protein